MSGNKFRPAGWHTLTKDGAPSDTPGFKDIVSGRDRENGAGGARSLAETGGRRAVAAVITPAGEKVLHHIGYKRVAKVVVIAFTVIAIMFGSLVAMVVSLVPTTAPVAIAGSVLSDAVELFGGEGGKDTMSAKELSEAGKAAGISCPARSSATAAPATNPYARPSVTPVAPASGTAAAETTAGRGVSPIRVNSDGSISRGDARALIDPLVPGISSLTANVWFMFRMAGLGDWDAFQQRYMSANLSDGDTAPNAVLRQVQTLNTRGVDMEQYRFTAAALTQAGQMTGRLRDPFPEFRKVVAGELVAGCMSGTSALRESMPAPSITTTPAAAAATGTAPAR